ncbi:MAG: hypothetical protein ACRYFY_02035 [Janthinobacterium lividum]
MPADQAEHLGLPQRLLNGAHGDGGPVSVAVPRKQSKPGERNQDDAAPEGVAAKDPEPLDAEAEAALASLEEELSGE